MVEFVVDDVVAMQRSAPSFKLCVFTLSQMLVIKLNMFKSNCAICSAHRRVHALTNSNSYFVTKIFALRAFFFHLSVESSASLLWIYIAILVIG